MLNFTNEKIILGLILAASAVTVFIMLMNTSKKPVIKTDKVDTVSYIITNANGIIFYASKIDSININCIEFKYGKFKYRVCGSYTIQEQITK